MSETLPDFPDGLPQPRRLWSVVALSVGLMMSVLDGSIANLALPTIARELAVSPAASIWVVNAYQLAVTMTLLPFAALGDIYGYRRVYQVGMVVFTLASLACAMSSTLVGLTIARIVQGLGAAGMMSVNSALVRFIYPRARLGQGFGVNVMVGSASSALGPSIAAAILSVANWPWLFAVNVPLGVIALALGARTLPATPRSDTRFDLGSAVLNAAAFGLLISSIDAIGHGGSASIAAMQLAGAIVAGVFLARRQVARPNPLLPVDLMRRPIFALSVMASTFSFAAQGMAYVSLPFYFQATLGRSQTVTGLLMTPWPLTVALVAPLAGRLADRFSAPLMGAIGQALMACGLASLALLPHDPGTWNIVWRMSLCGIGFGLFNSPNNRTMIASAPPSRSGGASGMQATSRLMGQTMGAALVALLFGLVGIGGQVTALALGAGFSVIAGVASVLRPRPQPRAA
ncbi:MAG: MFS transporter [Rhodospirillales bacterium]|nr:MFS transporter [Rhodospirillales bacterium]MDE2200185.1 MFS transporter [Rhodospirillales bacterium]MDE2575659.1 MFS transporter [Rhodospirillales bacterium]